MTGVGFLVSVVGDGVWRVSSGCVFSAGFHVVVVVDVVVVYAAVAAVVAAALALCREDNPRSLLLLRLFPLSSGCGWLSFGCGLFFSGCRCTGVVRRRRP